MGHRPCGAWDLNKVNGACLDIEHLLGPLKKILALVMGITMYSYHLPVTLSSFPGHCMTENTEKKSERHTKGGYFVISWENIMAEDLYITCTVSLAYTVHPRNAGGACLKPPLFP